MIRLATPEDADRLVTLAEHFLSATAYGPFLRASRDRLLALVDPVCTHGVIFVDEVIATPTSLPELEDDTRVIVGLIAIVAGEYPFSGEPFGEELVWWVEPAYRGQRGVELLEAAEQWARTRGLAFLKMVAPAESALGTFYRRHGYTALETVYQKPIARAA